MKSTNAQYDLQFLAGGGEMGQLMREKDWTTTTLGSPTYWPQSLRTTLSIILNSKFPMFLFWGPDLICFYNDAYRPSLGIDGKHPAILGGRGEDFWQEIWKDIKPIIDKVIDKGEASWYEDMLLPIYRNGKMEDVYWTFSYSPVNDESGKPAGVFVTCSETTAKVNAFHQLEESNQRYLNNIKQAPVAMCVFRGSDFVVETANKLMFELWGKGAHEIMNKPIFEGLPEAKEQGFEQLLQNVYTTGEKFVANEHLVLLPRKGKIESVYVNFVYEALTEPDGSISGIVATATEVTQQVNSKTKLQETEQKVRALVDNAPFAIAVYTGEEMRIELANQAIIDIWGKGNDVIGKTFTEVLPELAGQSVFEQIKEVYTSGKPFHTQNTPLDLIVNGKKDTFYFNYDFTPLYDLSGKIYGVMNTGIDLTDLNLAKKKIEEGDARFRNTVKQAPVGIVILRGKEYVVEMANDSYMELVDRNINEFIGSPLFDSIPEAKDSTLHLMDQVMDSGESYRGNEVPVPLKRSGEIAICNFDFVYHPLKEDDGTISGIIVTVTDVTEKVQSRKKIERNEERLNIVVEASELGTWELNMKTMDVNFSKRYLEILGFTKDDKPTHEEVKKLIHPDDLEFRDKAFNEALKSGILNYQIRLILNDQSVRWVEGRGKVFYDPDKQPIKLIGTIRDITYEKKYQHELEESEQRFRKLTDSAPVLIWMSGPDKMCYFFNKSWLDYTGRTMEQEYGEGWLEGIHADDLAEYLETYKTAFDKREEFTMEYRLKRHDGKYRWLTDKGVPRFTSSGEFEGYIGACMDIDNEKTNLQLLIKNEQKFRLLADSMPQHIWTSDTDGNLNYYNKSVVEYSGMSLKEIHEKGWLDIVHPDDREENIKQWLNAIKKGEEFLFEHRFRKHDGSYRWQLSRAIPQKDHDGRIQMWVGTSTDIQDQKTFTRELEKKVSERTKELNLLNETLQKSEERYHLMVEEVQDYAILYLTKEGIVENWNKGAEKIKGYKPEEIIGKSFSEFYTPKDKASNLPQYLLQQAARYGRFGQEGWRVRKDGTHFWASVVITAVHNEANEIIGFSKVTHDLSAKKEADDKLKRYAEQLEEYNIELEKKNKELQSFAYISSHDLQEPLRKIQLFSNQIIDREFDNLSETGKDRFNRMQNAAMRMQTLINDLLAYSRTNSQEKKFKLIDLDTIIDEVKENLKEEIEQKNGVIVAEKIGELPVIPFQFQQLMYNLISNSLKFTHADVAPHIEIKGEITKGEDIDNDKLEKDTYYCHITYSDNGIGFEEQYNEKIFEVFQRLHGKEVYPGTGIGLAIVKKIMDNHNGVITAKGNPGQGATFEIYIPMNN